MTGGPMSSPQRLSLRQSVALVWRTLRSMRTALILLLLIAVASVAGSLLPQWPNSPERVRAYLEDHPIWGTFLDRAGLFDVFGSWWFILLTALLFVSLVACLVPRTRAAWRTVRTPPMQARELDGFPRYAEVAMAVPPDEAISIARRTLRRRRFRVALDPSHPALAAEKGLARELGSLAFHWAFILLLVGVIVGKGTGFSGLAAVVEGETWVDAEANYDGTLRPGRFVGAHTGVGLRLRSFESAFSPNTGQAMDFVSDVDVLGADGSVVGRQEIRVNEPLRIEGLWIFQSGFGWAPMIDVEIDGEVVRSAPVVMQRDQAPEGVAEFAMPWRGIVKLPGAGAGGRDQAIELELWSDSRAFTALLRDLPPQPMLVAFDPIIRFTLYEGTLDDLSTFRLDKTNLEEVSSGIVGLGRTTDLLDGSPLPGGRRGSGSTISFPQLRQFSVFLVSRDSGVPLVLVAAILILVGLLPALYGSRRKVWVHAGPGPSGAVLRVGGLAMQRKPQFEEEFDRVVGALASASDRPSGPSGADAPPVAEPQGEGEKVQTP